MKAIFLVHLLLIPYFVNAQVQSDSVKERLFQYEAYASFGPSRFDATNLIGSPTYDSYETKWGFRFIKKLGTSRLSLGSGSGAAVKFKRDSYFFYEENLAYTYTPLAIPTLDRAASTRNYFIIELPLFLNVAIAKERVELRIGLLGRWQTLNDMLTAKELGFTFGAYKKFGRSIKLGVDLYNGLTNVHPVGIAGNVTGGRFTTLFVVNQSAMFTFVFSLD